MSITLIGNEELVTADRAAIIWVDKVKSSDYYCFFGFPSAADTLTAPFSFILVQPGSCRLLAGGLPKDDANADFGLSR